MLRELDFTIRELLDIQCKGEQMSCAEKKHIEYTIQLFQFAEDKMRDGVWTALNSEQKKFIEHILPGLVKANDIAIERICNKYDIQLDDRIYGAEQECYNDYFAEFHCCSE
jgi:uncharacterized protein YdcH (DUF465 family)